MILTLRDLELFKKLSSYAMLSSKQIGVLLFSSIEISTVLRRLRKLEDHRYLKRILGLESQDILWTITPKAAEAASVPIPKRHWSKNMLDHDFKLLSLRLALEGSGVAHSWLPEHEIRSSIFRSHGFRGAKQKLIPDGLMGIEVDDKRVSVAIELELTLKNKDKLRQTIRRYHNQSGIHAVWYIAPSMGILNSIFSLWHNMSSGADSTKLYVSLLEEVMKDPSKAQLGGHRPIRTVAQSWTMKGAHSPAQGVGTQYEKKEEQRMGLTG
jgi:hypothetical protein